MTILQWYNIEIKGRYFFLQIKKFVLDCIILPKSINEPKIEFWEEFEFWNIFDALLMQMSKKNRFWICPIIENIENFDFVQISWGTHKMTYHYFITVQFDILCPKKNFIIFHIFEYEVTSNVEFWKSSYITKNTKEMSLWSKIRKFCIFQKTSIVLLFEHIAFICT